MSIQQANMTSTRSIVPTSLVERTEHFSSEQATLQLIAKLFPAPTLGQDFVARFVEKALTERSIIPDLKAGDVMICTQSIATLSKELKLSYDTVQKYVALFRALGLLSKRPFIDGKIAFVLSLGIYLPPRGLEANLDCLLQGLSEKKSRSKYHDLVADVKGRCKIYGLIDQGFTDALWQVHALVQPPTGLSRSKLEQRFAQVLHLVSGMIEQVMAGRLPIQNLPGTAASRETKLQKQGSESTRPGSPGRFPENGAAPNLPGQAAQVDSRRRDHSHESTQDGHSGSFVDSHVVQNLPEPPIQVDLWQRDHDSESTQTAHPDRRAASSDAENLPSQAVQVDSQPVGADASLNVNVITLNDSSEKKNDDGNDSQEPASMTNDMYTPQEAGRVGPSLAQFFEPNLARMTSEQKRTTIGGFVNKCKNYSRTTVRAAVIDVLVHQTFPTIDPGDERGRPKKPGACFHQACDSYGKSGMPIPAFVARWLRTTLSREEIKQELANASKKYQGYMADPGTADLVRKFLCGEIDQQALDGALQLARQNDAPTGASLIERLDQEARGMDEESAASSSAPVHSIEKTPIAVQSSNQAPSDDQAKMDFARRQKPRAIELGIPQPTVQRPHRCGNPLFYSPTTWATPCCAYCGGDTKWPKEIWDLIESIRTYVGPRAPEDGRVMAVGAGLPG